MCFRFALSLAICSFLSPLSVAEEIPGWGVLVDPVGNCPVDFTKTGISLEVPAGIHDMNPYLHQTNAPRIWQEVTGDFLFEACMLDFPRPQSKTGVNGHQSYIASGLLVWQDDGNLLRWTRSASGEAKQIYLSCEQYENNAIVGGGNFPLEDKPVSLRVERRGDRIRMWATYDTTGWKMLLDRRCDYQRTLKVGVFGLNVTEKDVEFRFENAYLLAQKAKEESN
ncbi:hypothetical protein C5Y97_03370 [Blastopirellula marina]|uniref:DUF1349 domain-containing protein n=2 Tax=Blastopirellula marina TaxID=124 RepID=A0A2S8GBT5_9BACT|nr:hypothetical protein C5Y98_03370 [Blastopirellula marina]PTL46213.1 hypothetical protein C5Y97_03370 [Blastopirellula marina]